MSNVPPLEFVTFLAAVLVLYYLVPRKWQSVILLCANIFYCLTVSVFCLLTLLGVTSSAFCSSIVIERNRNGQSRGKCNREHIKSRRALIVGIALTLSSFVISKILELFESTSVIYGNAWSGMGLAFCSLTAVGYLIDVYRGKIKRERSFLRLFLFVGFFPCMRLGPISRYKDLAPQLSSPRAPTWENITSGLIRILWGYFKKLVVADTALVALNSIVAAPQTYSGGYALFLIILYSVVIYADFTGGIDVALGASRMLGITLRENFDRPFSSNSVREYWKRWHITLGAFFSDYVFYPLSISKPMQRLSKRLRKSRCRGISKRVPIYIALVATWILTGAWHGLSANYILWGLSNAAVIIAAQEFSSVRAKRQKKCAGLTAAAHTHLAPNRAPAARTSIPTARRICAVRTFFIIGVIRLFDLWNNPVTALRAVASIFFDFGGWTRLFSGGILALGLSAREWIVIIFGVALMFAVSCFAVAHPRAASPCSTPPHSAHPRAASPRSTPPHSAHSRAASPRYTPPHSAHSRATHPHNAREFIMKKPLATTFCIVFLLLVTLIFGSYGIGFEESSFIYSKF